jgi:hypothetical protein
MSACASIYGMGVGIFSDSKNGGTDHAYRSVDLSESYPKKQRTQNRFGKRVVHRKRFNNLGLSDKRLRSIDDDPGELISYSEWKDQQSIDAYSVREARERN